MAETRTSRMGMPQYSAGTDSPSRADFNEAFLAIENRTARADAGLLSARPLATAAKNFVYLATDTGEFFWSTGTAWIILGNISHDFVSTASAANKVAMLAKGFTSQTANLIEARNASNQLLSFISANGDFASGGVYIPTRTGGAGGTPTDAALNVGATSAGQIIAKIRALASQTGDFLQLLDSTDAVVAKVDKNGTATFPKVISSSAPASGSDLTNKTYVDGKNWDASAINTGVLNVARIPDLDAGKIVSGTFSTARIPNIDASKITTGIIGQSFIPDEICPVGTMMEWAGDTVPTNWLECNAAAVSRTSYARLFAAVSTKYGVGNGSTTFNLPDVPRKYAQRVSETTGYFNSSDFSVTSALMEIINDVVMIKVRVQKVGATLTPDANGGVADTDMLLLPDAFIPDIDQAVSGTTPARVMNGYCGTDGIVKLAAVGGSAGIASGAIFNFSGSWPALPPASPYLSKMTIIRAR